jgi:hypothetical protein
MALQDTLIGDKPVKVEVDFSQRVQTTVIIVIIAFVIITYLVIRHRKNTAS